MTKKKDKALNKQGYIFKITKADVKNTENNPRLQKILAKLLDTYKIFLLESANSMFDQIGKLSKYVKNRQYHRN